MDTIEAIMSRISTRAFTDEPVSERAVREILDIARFSPSSSNIQPWGVVVTADSSHIIVAEYWGKRLQLLRLIVSGDGGTRAELAFVRSIGDGQLPIQSGVHRSCDDRGE